MSTNTEYTVSGADKFLALLSVLVVAAGVAGYYYFSSQSVLVRVPMVAAGVVGGLLVFYQSQLGKRLWKFIQTSRGEIRKVVWPTRQEAVQTTLAVIVFTLVLGLFFWGLDLILSFVVRTVQGA